MESSPVSWLSVPSFKAHFTPTVEILWRLDPRLWGRGLVTLAAREVLNLVFAELGLEEVVAFAVVRNQRSIRVMERLEMKRYSEPFFDHPGVSDERLRRHVLYRARC
jgi:RimJ/RimL family protein N-acetyltransferase